MNQTTLRILVVGLLPLSMLMATVFGGEEQTETVFVRIYLPREKTVSQPTLTLADIAFVAGDKALAKTAGDVSLGRAPFPGEELTLDRHTILTRLAAEKIDAGIVEFLGAEEIKLHRKADAITVEELIRAGTEALARDPRTATLRWNLFENPKALLFEKHPAAAVSSTVAGDLEHGIARVRISIVDGENVIASTEMTFQRVYYRRVLVAAEAIPPGKVLCDENTDIVTRNTTHDPGEENLPPMGAVTNHSIRAGEEITMTGLVLPKPRHVIDRNAAVRIVIGGPGWTITALGEALQDGRVGEVIRVRNADSKRIIQAEVLEDGTVAPLVNER